MSGLPSGDGPNQRRTLPDGRIAERGRSTLVGRNLRGAGAVVLNQPRQKFA
jgi:hypothetical protein